MTCAPVSSSASSRSCVSSSSVHGSPVSGVEDGSVIAYLQMLPVAVVGAGLGITGCRRCAGRAARVRDVSAVCSWSPDRFGDDHGIAEVDLAVPVLAGDQYESPGEGLGED